MEAGDIFRTQDRVTYQKDTLTLAQVAVGMT